MSANLVAWLEAELGRVEELARTASAGPWWAEDTSPRRWGDDRDAEVVTAKGRFAVLPYDKNGALNADHIARHSPASVLRRVAADRALLADLLAERHEVVEDCWYTCSAATEERDFGETCRDLPDGSPCDCGRDARVERRVRLLAEAWGWEGTV